MFNTRYMHLFIFSSIVRSSIISYICFMYIYRYIFRYMLIFSSVARSSISYHIIHALMLLPGMIRFFVFVAAAPIRLCIIMLRHGTDMHPAILQTPCSATFYLAPCVRYSIRKVAYGFIRVANEAMCRPIRNLTTMKVRQTSFRCTCITT